MFRNYLSIALALTIVFSMIGCSSLKPKTRSIERAPAVVEEDLHASSDSRRENDPQRDRYGEPTESTPIYDEEKLRVEPPIPYESTEAAPPEQEPAQRSPKSYIFKDIKGNGKSWAHGDAER